MDWQIPLNTKPYISPVNEQEPRLCVGPACVFHINRLSVCGPLSSDFSQHNQLGQASYQLINE